MKKASAIGGGLLLFQNGVYSGSTELIREMILGLKVYVTDQEIRASGFWINAVNP